MSDTGDSDVSEIEVEVSGSDLSSIRSNISDDIDMSTVGVSSTQTAPFTLTARPYLPLT